jgi:hypothetical protein
VITKITHGAVISRVSGIAVTFNQSAYNRAITVKRTTGRQTGLIKHTVAIIWMIPCSTAATGISGPAIVACTDYLMCAVITGSMVVTGIGLTALICHAEPGAHMITG